MAMSTSIYSTLSQGFAAGAGAAVWLVVAMMSPPLWQFADLSAASLRTIVPPDHSQDQFARRCQWRRHLSAVKSSAACWLGLRSFALSEPPRHPRNRFAHFVGRAGIGKANE